MTTDSLSLEATVDDDQLSGLNEHIGKTYDEQVYTSNAFPFSSPRHLRAAAHLYGLSSVPLAKARVLELGCAGGGNLLPFALAYPDAQVVGVDLSAVQVAQGVEVTQALGIENLQLHAMSLTDITADFGQFDYIIAHGVFSWVPPEVREAMLRILQQNLSPNGIGYISYNTYPGWKAGDIVRDAMLLHSHSDTTTGDKLASAKTMLRLLSDGVASSNPLAPSLRAAVKQLERHSDYYIAHEYLEMFNNPCYLLEFVSMAAEYGLTHVGDSEPHVELSATYGQNVQLNHSLIALGQPREMRQQYLDFAVGRNFRKSVMVHSERSEQVLVSPELERLADLRWAGFFTEIKKTDNATNNRLSFRNHKNRDIHSSDAVVISVLRSLSQAWPASLSFDSLLEQVRPSITKADDDAEARNALLTALETLFRINVLRYTLEASPYDQAESPQSNAPTLIPGLSHLYQQRKDSSFGIGMFNLWHDTTNLQLKDAEAIVLTHIDGSNSRKQLATLLRDALSRGTVPNVDGKSLKGQRNLDTTADKIVANLLDLLKRQGLLV